ncbi:hypothetical protein ACE3MS_16045 [Paenibacillus dendritiformis]|uniref:hypothetical protein n=1 Tax=Paenibacillus dendritiformis TaxID=130049 RepID=UPI003660DCED
MKKYIVGFVLGALTMLSITAFTGTVLTFEGNSIGLVNVKDATVNTVVDNNNGAVVTDNIQLANAKSKLNILSAYNDTEAYHPKVISFDKPWNGYYYWMAFTPYPGGDQAKENPHVLASNDMVTWVEPKGYKNPLEPQPTGTPEKQYNSDTHIVFNPTLDRIEVFWRYIDDDLKISTIYRKTSNDGVNWNAKEVVLSGDRKTSDHVSPAVIYEDGKYKMWYVANGYKVWYIESSNGTTWSSPREIVIPYETPMKNWHLDVIHTDVGYEMVIVSFTDGQDRNSMSLFHTTSVDNLNFSTAKVILKPSKQDFAWDNKGIYRSTILKQDGNYYIFYSGISKEDKRGVGLSVGMDLQQLKGME